jgi:hypothetical protein
MSSMDETHPLPESIHSLSDEIHPLPQSIYVIHG